jgi:hypothetical protein
MNAMRLPLFSSLRRIGVLALSLLAFSAPALAVWPQSFGGNGDDEIKVVRHASNGDVYIAGHFSGTMQVGFDTLTSRGGQDIFVARLSASGQVIWARSAGSIVGDSLRDIALDPAYNVYLVGEFSDTARFGGGIELFADGPFSDGFVAKINPSGEWQWARRMGGPGTDVATGVVVLPGNSTVIPQIPESVLVVGHYECQAKFGKDKDDNDVTLSKSSCFLGATDLFAARFASNGQTLWAVDRGGSATRADVAEHIAIDSDNRVYIVGSEAQGGLTNRLNEPFNNLNSWTSSDLRYGTVFAGSGSVSYTSVSPFCGGGTVNYNIFTGTNHLVLRGRSATVQSNVFNTLGRQALRISLEAMRGGTFNQGFPNDVFRTLISELPDGGENLRVQYLGGDGAWRTIEQFNGGGAQGQRFLRVNDTAYVLTPESHPQAFHAGFRLRFFYTTGSGGPFDWCLNSSLQQVSCGSSSACIKATTPGFYDWWHVDDVRIDEVGAKVPFVLTMSNVLSGTPSFSAPTALPGALTVNDIATFGSGSGRRLLVSGRASGDTVLAPCTTSGSGAYVASLNADTLACVWARNVGNAEGRAVASDSAGNVYTTGVFSGSATFKNDPGAITLNSHGGSPDVYVAAYSPIGAPLWATGGDRHDPSGVPSFAGGGGDDRGLAIATDGASTVYVGGRFEAVAQFGQSDTLAAIDQADAFLVNLGTDGRFFEEEKWIAGVPVMPPDNAETSKLAFVPDFTLGGAPFDAIGNKIFYWDGPIGSEPAKLIPLQPISGVEVRWRVKDQPLESEQRIPRTGGIAWPTAPCAQSDTKNCFQVHVVGAPVEAEPPAGGFKVLELINPGTGGSGATYSAGQFSAERSGTSVLLYVQGPTLDVQQYPVVAEIVRTLPYTAVPLFVDNVPVEIGQKIIEPFHNEPNRTGFVVNELAYYDGLGADAAYNRSSRTGAIIPVNRYSAARPQEQGRELAVAWYRANGKGVFWPAKSVRYAPHWPFDPDRIIIASQQGSEVLGQPVLSPTQFPSARIYIQNDFALPGFNPNDEHAFTAPSATGSGFEAVFALRSDFGSNLTGDQAAASDPYTLLKYFDNAALEWRFRVYKVDATGAGFSQFRFTGTAGTTVSPPYPVRLLPSCQQSFVLGQAVGEQPPPPFFQDYKAQIWAKSAGSGSVLYYYPAQPGFFTDIDNNNSNDIQPGSCVPWLARLPASQGGSTSPLDPILVAYDISWPDETPLLVNGETLLRPKRGLPNIFDQAAAQVVYDDIQDTTDSPLPSDTLAQMLDPLNPRIVFLPEMPEAIATEFQTDGTRLILGSADGSLNLPVSVRQRLRYDAQNGRLILTGIFDESGAGEPFLLLNVLSKRDRAVLKRLNGGDGNEQSDFTGSCASLAAGCTWDQAVEALFRLSRNPQGIQKICLQSILDENRNRVCQLSRDVNEDDVLVGYQDSNDDGVLEPFRAVGVKAALSAGLSQGEGYMTLAFNNDPALNPLPVSLEVIQIGCLRSSSLPDDSPYQGQINVIMPDNIFDEQLVLRHSGDFGGNPDALEFEWFFHPDMDGTPPMPLPQPEIGQLNGWFQFPTPNPQGQVDISIEGANIQTLSDNWYLARYRGLPACGNATKWSLWAGQPGATPLNQRAQLAIGWVKRVLSRLNPFEARVQNFAQSATNNFASMLIQLGERYEGPIALNNDPDNLNRIGLIEAYTTVMRRALQLSVDATPPVDYGPANAAILLVASRLVDFYTLLGNEAYADAQDPTIGITTNSGEFSLAPSIFNFQNQLASLLEEELILLRGRDDSFGPVAARPVYNRLFWNFTTGDGEVAYALSYNISDQNGDGVIDEFDARIMFPQGHGDAWGHYLTATKIYYELLRHPFFSWNPQTEAIPVAGVPITVDFLDERQFAETAAAKARTGAEVVDLTYRLNYVDDPNGQWQGYDDVNPDRAWGLSEWGRRAGMAAYFDWATINAILPDEDPDPDKVSIQRIDRRTVSEIGEIAGHYANIQGQTDKADAGLNPLGLARDVVPFDIDPAQLTNFNKTQFEQIHERAMGALTNAVQVWDYANELNNQMRRNQNEVDDLAVHANNQETDFSNQLIEIFGYPYADDIGPAGTYPAGYNGPDIYNYMLVDVPALAGTAFDFDSELGDLGINRIRQFTGVYAPVENGLNFFDLSPNAENYQATGDNGQSCTAQPYSKGCALGELDLTDTLEVEYTVIESPDFGFWFTKPESWSGQRRAPGRLQQILQQMLQARIALKQVLLEYDNLAVDIQIAIDNTQAVFDLSESNLNISIAQRNELLNLTIATEVTKNAAIIARRVGEIVDGSFKDSSECIPKQIIAGLAAGGDVLSAARCAVYTVGSVTKGVLDTVADGLDIASNATDAAKEDVSELSGIKTAINDSLLELYNASGEIDVLMRKEPMLRAEVFARTEAIKQLTGDYQATLAEGLRVMDRLVTFRKQGAAAIQEYRYQDMAFRIFRNDALQKYRASFDLAARYVFLAAAAYDYDTNLLGSNTQAGQKFLTNVVRQRSIGQIINGVPMPGTPGLADTMAQLKLNFDVLKGQMGFNNPQVETNRFSLRRELFRIPEGPEGDDAWRRKLDSMRVADLWAVPEFRRYARPFAPQSAGPQPGLVIDFTTNVTFGLNFFGWDLGAQDSSYDSSQFATRVRSVGAWFRDYAGLPLADDPRIYLYPAGADVMRAPSAFDFTTREWQVVDQAVPIPFPVGSADLGRFDWNPVADTLSGSSTEVRRYGRFRAFHFAEPFDDSQVTTESRLIGRSVWNRRWVIIIPGGTFLADPNEGLETFIHGAPIPGGGGTRDGQGISDILIFFKTYAYSGL